MPIPFGARDHAEALGVAHVAHTHFGVTRRTTRNEGLEISKVDQFVAVWTTGAPAPTSG